MYDSGNGNNTANVRFVKFLAVAVRAVYVPLSTRCKNRTNVERQSIGCNRLQPITVFGVSKVELSCHRNASGAS